MNEDPRTIIGRRLKEAREYLNLSQEEAASFAKISRSAISLIENGQRKLDSVELMNLAKLYQKPIAYFTEENFSVEPILWQRCLLVAFQHYLKMTRKNYSNLPSF